MDDIVIKLREMESEDVFNTLKDEMEVEDPSIPELSGVLSVFKDDWNTLNKQLEESQQNMNKLIHQLNLSNLKINSLIQEKKLLQSSIKDLKDDLYINQSNEKILSDSLSKLKQETQSLIYTKYTCPICDSGSGLSKYIIDYWERAPKEKKMHPRSLIKEMLDSIDAEILQM